MYNLKSLVTEAVLVYGVFGIMYNVASFSIFVLMEIEKKTPNEEKICKNSYGCTSLVYNSIRIFAQLYKTKLYNIFHIFTINKCRHGY